MTTALPCITNVLPDIASCTVRDEHLTNCMNSICSGCWPRAAQRGEVCSRCYDRIDHAIQTADHLRNVLAGVDRAIAAETSSHIPGPRVPLTAIRLDFDAIDRAQNGHADAGDWVSTEAGAAEAVRFARLVRAADRAHPTQEADRKLQRLRCPTCKRLTAIWQPPAWVGDEVTITCIDQSCGWTATNPNAIDIVTAIEVRGAA